jgi:hypothetical protein
VAGRYEKNDGGLKEKIQEALDKARSAAGIATAAR